MHGLVFRLMVLFNLKRVAEALSVLSYSQKACFALNVIKILCPLCKIHPTNWTCTLYLQLMLWIIWGTPAYERLLFSLIFFISVSYSSVILINHQSICVMQFLNWLRHGPWANLHWVTFTTSSFSQLYILWKV